MPSTKIYRTLQSLNSLPQPVVASIGNFDGLHLGHQELLKKLIGIRNVSGAGCCLVMSFYPHPAVVLGRMEKDGSILTLWQRQSLLSALGIDVLFLQLFTEAFSKLPAQEFILRILRDGLKVKHLLVGADAAVGHKREGTISVMKRLLEPAGVSVEVMDEVSLEGVRVSSRLIREALQNGDVAKAAKFMGRPFELYAPVVRGSGRGAGIGYPTANLGNNGQILPRNGVYCCKAIIGGKKFGALANIGVRPTFGGGVRRAEAYLLDYCGQAFYEQKIRLEFISRLREEKKFNSVDELIRQIRADVEKARAFF